MQQPSSGSPVPSLPPVRRYTLYGGACGMLVGLAYVASTEANPDREVAIWRNFILAGCLVGLGCGAVLAWLKRGKSARAASSQRPDSPTSSSDSELDGTL